MYSAPSVSYPVGRCAFQCWLLGLQNSASVVLWLAWGWDQPFSLTWFLTGLGLSMVAWCGVRAVGRSPISLHWDRETWFVQFAEAAQTDAPRICVSEVKPVLDLQSILLLQWQPLSFTLGKSKQWLWVSQSTCPELWLDLRRAVYAHRQ